jgi:hypothetical protein
MQEFDQAVAAASEAFKTWRTSSVLTRQRFALEYVLQCQCESGLFMFILPSDFSIYSANIQMQSLTALFSNRAKHMLMLKVTCSEDSKLLKPLLASQRLC